MFSASSPDGFFASENFCCFATLHDAKTAYAQPPRPPITGIDVTFPDSSSFLRQSFPEKKGKKPAKKRKKSALVHAASGGSVSRVAQRRRKPLALDTSPLWRGTLGAFFYALPPRSRHKKQSLKIRVITPFFRPLCPLCWTYMSSTVYIFFVMKS